MFLTLAAAILLLFASCFSVYGKTGLDNTFSERVFRFMERSYADSSYAVRSGYKYSVTPYLGVSFDSYSFEWIDAEGNEQNYDVVSNPIYQIGVGVSYRNLSIGANTKLGDSFGFGSNKSTEFTLTMYGQKFGFDLCYNTSNRFSIMHDEPEFSIDTRCFTTDNFFASCYYVFNNKRFSFPAVFTQSYIQKRSCGSLVIGLLGNSGSMRIDTENLPIEIKDEIDTIASIRKIEYSNVGVKAGYAYNWVKGKDQQWLLHLSALPSLYYNIKSRFLFTEGKENGDVTVGFGAIIRMGAMWNTDKMFGGINFVVNINNSIVNKPVEVTDVYGRVKIYYGFRF